MEIDQIFFAASASHVLAFLFIQLHQDEGYEIRHLKPVGDRVGHHVYVSNGVWAFDHNGWTLEAELLEVTVAAYEAKYPGWNFDLISVPSGLEDFCANSYFRPPAYFLHLPWEWTYNYIRQFPASPPDEWLP